MEKTQWSVNYATAHKPKPKEKEKVLPMYNIRIFADLAAIGIKGAKDGDTFRNNIITHNEMINYVDAVQLVRIEDGFAPEKSDPNPKLDGAGTIIADNVFYTTSLLYTDGDGNFMKSGERAVTENALDFKFGSLDPKNPIKIFNNFMFGYRNVDNTYSYLSDNGNAMVFHFGAGNITVEGNSIHAYNTESLTIRGNAFVDTKVMYFAPDHMDLRSKDLVIEDNAFYIMEFTGIPSFAASSNNSHLTKPFDWSSYLKRAPTQIFSESPVFISIFP